MDRNDLKENLNKFPAVLTAGTPYPALNELVRDVPPRNLPSTLSLKIEKVRRTSFIVFNKRLIKNKNGLIRIFNLCIRNRERLITWSKSISIFIKKT